MTRPPPPPSAVSLATGVAGLMGLSAALVGVAAVDAPPAWRPLVCLAATAAPMMLWAIVRERVHREAPAGLDWTRARPLGEAAQTTAVKLVGLWATWAAIAAAYWALRVFHTPAYGYAFDLARAAAPPAVLLSVPYVLLVDRRMAEPRDGLWHAGAWLLGRGGEVDRGALADHARAWLVKGFFLVFMLTVLPASVTWATSQPLGKVFVDPTQAAAWLIALMFVFDVCFGTVGYLCTLRPLGAHIRSANPRLDAWVAALICYPPFVLMGPGGPINYTRHTRDWSAWFAGQDGLLIAWGGLLVGLAALYAWSTVIFGLRFSNLTHRGIITNGPYAWFKHPAYLSKNAFWWLSVLPFLTTQGGPAEAARNCVLLAGVNAVYFWRAKTEEMHLIADPAYRAYSVWIETHGLLPRLRRALFGPRAPPGVAPAPARRQ